MSEERHTLANEVDDGEPLTPERVAEACGARATLVVRLVRLGLLETARDAGDEMLLPARSILHLRRMQRLRRDLGVNFAGARVILGLVEEIERLRRARPPRAEEDAADV